MIMNNFEYGEGQEYLSLDFARCQRPDGTYYGTSGACRKGVSVGPREKAALRKAAKAGDKRAEAALKVVEGKMTKAQAKKELGGGGEAKAAPAPKAKEQPKKVESKSDAKPSKKEGYEPKRKSEEEEKTALQKVKDKVTSSSEKNDISEVGFKDENQIKLMYDFRRESTNQIKDPGAREKALKQVDEREANALRTHSANKKFAADIKRELPSNVKTSLDDQGSIVMSSKVGENKVEAVFSPQTGWNYQVNGGYDAGSVKSRKEQVQIAQQVRQMYDATVRSLPQGTVIKTSAWSRDGGGERRTKAYERLGFKVDKKSGTMFSRKEGDRMVGSSPLADNNDSNLINFAEENMDEIWMDIIFPSSRDKEAKE